MTAQIMDKIFYSDDEYSIIAIENDWPFEPLNYGLQPKATSTACYRGYYCEYSFLENHLALSKLCIGFDIEKKPIFMGIDAKKSKYYKFNGFWEYSAINMPIDYSGGIVIGREFIREFYVHMGFHRPHCFKYVIELYIKKGKIDKSIDHSKRMDEVRQLIRSNKESASKFSLHDGNIEQFVEDSFSLSYVKK